MTPREMAEELREALAAHEATYPLGDWKEVNERIGSVRTKIDEWIVERGLWPKGKTAIGNAQALSILNPSH